MQDCDHLPLREARTRCSICGKGGSELRISSGSVGSPQIILPDDRDSYDRHIPDAERYSVCQRVVQCCTDEIYAGVGLTLCVPRPRTLKYTD